LLVTLNILFTKDGVAKKVLLIYIDGFMLVYYLQQSLHRLLRKDFGRGNCYSQIPKDWIYLPLHFIWKKNLEKWKSHTEKAIKAR